MKAFPNPVAWLACVCLVGCSCSQPDRSGAFGPEAGSTADISPRTSDGGAAAAGSHALAPALETLRKAEAHLENNVRDYSAVLVRRERTGAKLGPRQSLRIKIRHKPFSVYVCALEPESQKGDEAIYVEGENEGKLLGHTTGVMGKMLGTLRLDPQGTLAMQNQRYPITEMGVLNFCRRLIRTLEEDLNYEECEVKLLPGQKVNERACTAVEIIHPVRREHFRFHLARVLVDDELKTPIRHESYDWPQKPGAEPEIIEEYTYTDIKLNPGLTDGDFDPRNPEYGFP